MNCPQCSAPLREEEFNCPTCGSAVSPTAPTIDVPQEASRHPLDFPPGARFAKRYTIIESAGRGGMGVVYKAIDDTLGATVALKLIRPDLADNAAFQKLFKREVLLTRQITDPHVCRVHDLGEGQGLLYISMEWIDGETLRRFLNQSGRVEPTRALEISEAIARGLAAAHQKEIIHRDLKPENVMIDKAGTVNVLDFGLAVERGDFDSAGSSGRSGTPAYQSPEQRQGKDVDARSDLYALGLILREMLTGQHPSPGQPPSHRLPDPLPRRIQPILDGLLEEKLEKRFDSAAAVAEALRKIRKTFSKPANFSEKLTRIYRRNKTAFWLGGVLAAALGIYFMAPPSSPVSQIPSPGQGYYDSALHTLDYEAETDQSLDDAIQMLHRAVRKHPSFAAAWARLGGAYWIRYERTREESSRAEATKALAKAFELEPNLPEVNYAQGRGFMAEGKHRDAIRVLKRAVQGRHDFDAAWGMLGVAYQELDDFEHALSALETAIKLRPESAKHRIRLGRLYYHFKLFDQAVEAHRKATLLKPDSRMAWVNLGASLLEKGLAERAIQAFTRSLEIYPEDSFALSNMGTAYYSQKNYESALDYYRRAIDLEPKNPVYWGNLGDALTMLEREPDAHEAYREAVVQAQRMVDLQPQDPTAHLYLGLYCARDGNEPCALREGRLALELRPDNAEVLFQNAVIYCILGRPDEALDWLERSIQLGLSKAVIEMDPYLSRLREHPRYQALLELAS